MDYSSKQKTPRIWWGSLKFEELITPYYFQNSFHRYGLVFDSSIPFIKFQNYSQVHFKKRSFVIVKNEIDSIDINFIKVVKTD